MNLVNGRISLIIRILTFIIIVACANQEMLKDKAEIVARKWIANNREEIVTTLTKAVADQFQISIANDEIVSRAMNSLESLRVSDPVSKATQEDNGTGKPWNVILCSDFKPVDTIINYCLLVTVRLGLFSSAESIYLKNLQYNGQVTILNKRIM